MIKFFSTISPIIIGLLFVWYLEINLHRQQVAPLSASTSVVAQVAAPGFSQNKLADAKTIADLPPGTLPKDGDQIYIISNAPDGSTIGIDGDTLVVQDGKADFLVVVHPSKIVTDDKGDVIVLGVMKQEFDCKNHTYSNLYKFIIGPGGKILDYEAATEPREIKPGTTGEAIMERLCTSSSLETDKEPRRKNTFI